MNIDRALSARPSYYLSDDQIAEIIRLRRNGHTLREVVAMVGVASGTVTHYTRVAGITVGPDDPRWKYMPRPLFLRLAEYTDVSGECWLWTAALDVNGYGVIYRDGRNVQAHIATYEFCVGPVPPGLELDHLCRNHRCVNPEHLEPVTHRENVLRGESPAAYHARKTTCPVGHQYVLKQDGTRYCRECKRDLDRQRRRQRGIPPRSQPHFGTSKVCSVCETEKQLDAFYRRATHPDGRMAMCKLCYREKYVLPQRGDALST